MISRSKITAHFEVVLILHSKQYRFFKKHPSVLMPEGFLLKNIYCLECTANLSLLRIFPLNDLVILRLFLATATHNFKCLKITHICLI